MPGKSWSVKTAIVLSLACLIVIMVAVSFFIFRNTTLSYNIKIPEIPLPTRPAFNYGEQPALSDPDFFLNVKKQLIDQGTGFIEADLSTMVLRVYKEGNLLIEVPIVTKGREGSWWETPAGLYKIGSKEKEHFSSIGHVWMPWSMSFQGNFFIHGRTYYEDGTLTSNQYTGGCIRLGTEDAQKVFDSVSVGTPILVFEKSFSPDSFSYRPKNIPTIQAPVYLAADLGNNHVFANQEATTTVPIASITKLMTALIATEYINLDSVATVPKEAIVYTSKARLKAGEQYSIYQLLFPLLMESSNESAETIARHFGRSGFINRMNEKAAAIGMTATHFADPSGASALNVSTAEDLFMLAKYINNNRSFIFKITSGRILNSAYGETEWKDIGNFNDFIENQYFAGGKNGKTTAAGETSLSVLNLPVGDTVRPIVVIVLGSANARLDAGKLLEYTSSLF